MRMEDPLQRYAALLVEWNRRVNLTAARTMDEVKAHLDDALGLLALDWAGLREVVDIGSGGGLPGIPIAITLRQVRVTLVEASLRKAAFLQHVAGTLELALPLVRPGGDLLAEVGRLEPQSLSIPAARLGGGTPGLELLAGGRTVLRVPKVAPSPDAYPRRPGVPNRRPLT